MSQKASTGPDVVVWLWPDCVPTWNAWQAIQTQWRVGGMGGCTGLDYAGVKAWLDECGPDKPAKRREWFACFQACEAATLAAWAKAKRNADSAA